MRFAPFAFIGGQEITAQLYFDVDNYDSYVSGSTTWYNIGTIKSNANSNLIVNSSWYKTDATGSYIEPPSNTYLSFNGTLTNQPRVTTYIYEIDVATSYDGQKFIGRDTSPNQYWCLMAGGFFAAGQGGTFPATWYSTLAVSSTMQNNYFHVAVQNNFTGAGRGTTTYFTSLDNFTTGYSVNFDPNRGVAFALDNLEFISSGIGKIKSIGGYYKLLTTSQMQTYSQTGPYV